MTLRSLALGVVTCVSFISLISGQLTFPHTDPVSGQLLQCHQCPAGSYMQAPCTSRQQTDCQPCPANHFTQFENYLPKCLYCSTFCNAHQVVKRECSVTGDRVCECREGYYMHADFCLKHRDCPPGYGVTHKGNALRNTECMECPAGMFSAEKSATGVCISHNSCGSLRTALRGSSWHDNICMSCEEQKYKGTLAPLRGILTALFSQEKLRPARLRRVMRHFQGVRLEWRNRGALRSGLQERAKMLRAIGNWAKTAPEVMLRRLPGALRREMFNTAVDLEFLITDIEEGMKQCETVSSTTEMTHGDRLNHMDVYSVAL